MSLNRLVVCCVAFSCFLPWFSVRNAALVFGSFLAVALCCRCCFGYVLSALLRFVVAIDPGDLADAEVKPTGDEKHAAQIPRELGHTSPQFCMLCARLAPRGYWYAYGAAVAGPSPSTALVMAQPVLLGSSSPVIGKSSLVRMLSRAYSLQLD